MGKENKGKNQEMDSDERLRMENEIEKLKLTGQYGAKFSENSDLPPEIESEWLNHIKKFEEQFENAEYIKVAERLGNPHYPPVEELNDDQIEEKLEEVEKLMAENGIYLDAICDVEPAEMYRFIIEELFEHEMDDIKIEGMNTNFIYEEFHPNDKLDIERSVNDFIQEMLSDDFRDYLELHLSDRCKTIENKVISKEEVNEKALKFGDIFDHFNIETLADFHFDIADDNNSAAVQFIIDYEAVSGKKATSYIGEGRAEMLRGDLGYWNIVTLSIPGFSF